MAEIRNFGFIRHLRAEPSSFVLAYKRGQLVSRGRGMAFWFLPMSTGAAEVPVDDREETVLFHGRTADFQDITAQGTLTYRISDPEALADRVDFSVDLRTGLHLKRPFDKLSVMLTQLAQQQAWAYVAQTPVRRVLAEGHDVIRARIEEGLDSDDTLGSLGLELVSMRVSSVAPTPDLEKALEAPMRERIQQDADEAAFARRALAVEKERAIQENELQNRIELARREEGLIEQEGANARHQAGESAEAMRIDAEGEAARSLTKAEAAASRTRIHGDASAASLRAIEGARVELEARRMAIYEELSPATLMALAARELAGKLERIDHLNISPELVGPMLANLIEAGTARLGGGEGA